MRKALVVGIDNYPAPNSLNGCVNDAVEVAALLEANGNGSPNFDILRLISSEKPVTASVLHDAIVETFSGSADTALFYFAGHGVLDESTNTGYLITEDGASPNWGISLSSLLDLANKANPRIGSVVIILDSCQSGFAGELAGFGTAGVSVIGTGVTILTACHKFGAAAESAKHGKFTDIILDGLKGAASDILGRVTPASLYAHVDQTLNAFEQRPIYKANVQTFVTLREVVPKVPKEVLRRLVQYFPSPSHVFPLDPSYEPDRGEEAERLKDVLVNFDNVRIYRELQKCHQHGLVVPSEHEFMWHSAIFNGGCRLTATGAHFRKLAEKKRI